MASTRPLARTIRAAPVAPVAPAARVVPAIIPVAPAARVVPADPEDPAITPADLVAPAGLAITPADLVAPAGLAITPADRADPADLAITPADRADPADPAITPADSVDRILTRAARGTEMTTAAISAGHRGAMGRHPGAPASRRGRHGIDRFRRPVGAGTTARSITGVTTKRLTGTPVSISGDLTSSECGSRCDR